MTTPLADRIYALPSGGRWSCEYCRRPNDQARTNCQGCGAPATLEAMAGAIFVDAELLAAQHATPQVFAGQMYPAWTGSTGGAR